MNLKKILGKVIADKVKSGDCLGIGTGTTAEEAIRAIGERIKLEGIEVTGVSTSQVSTELATSLGIKIIPMTSTLIFNWGFDGADEVSEDNTLIKGKGGALLKEKIVSHRLPEWIITVTEDKLAKKIGENCALPIEVVPMALGQVENELKILGAIESNVRTGTNFYGPLFTENGNMIIDAKFLDLNIELSNKIKNITGVVEHGYFPANNRTKVLVAKANGETYFR